MDTREYKCSFGIVKITIDGNQCSGTYQKNGEFTGTIDGNIVKAKWNNEGKEGLIELDLSDDKLAGKWKQGLDEGTMRGKWQGEIYNSNEKNGSTDKSDEVLSLDQIIEIIKVLCKDHESIDEIITDLSDNTYLDHWAKQLIDDENNNIKRVAKNLYLIHLKNLEDPSFDDILTVAEELADESLFNNTSLAASFYKKAEDSAKSSGDFAQLAEKLIDSNKDKAIALYIKAENLAETLDELIELANLVIVHDEEKAIILFKKAESIATTFNDYVSVGTAVKDIDKDWGRKLYEKASNHISSLDEFNKIINKAFYDFEDHKWGSKMANKAIKELMKADDLFEFCGYYDALIELADEVVSENGLSDKECAKNIFNKLKEYEAVSAQLEGSRKVIEIYGLDDEYTQEFCNQSVTRAIEFLEEGYYMDVFRFIQDDLEDEDRASDFYSEYEKECEYDEENY